MRLGVNSANELLEKIKMVTGKEVLVANERGFILSGGDKGELSLAAYQSVKNNSHSFDEEAGTFWRSIDYEGQAIGAFGVKDKKVTEDMLSVISGMAEVILYQHFILNNLYSVTDIRANFLKDLLENDKYSSYEDVLSQADVLKINLRAQQAVMVVKVIDLVENYAKSLGKIQEEQKKIKILKYLQDIEQTIKAAFKDYDQNVVIYTGDNKFVILKGIGLEGLNVTQQNSEKYLREKAKYIFDTLKKEFEDQRIAIGIGQYYPDLEGLKKSYQDALIGLDIGLKIWGAERIYHILDVGTFAALSGEISHKRKIEISKQVLGKLLDNDELLRTVRSFLSSGMSLTEAAKELHLHRNTLIYRLNKVKSLIGLDPKKFSDALKIKLGLLVCQVK